MCCTLHYADSKVNPTLPAIRLQPPRSKILQVKPCRGHTLDAQFEDGFVVLPYSRAVHVVVKIQRNASATTDISIGLGQLEWEPARTHGLGSALPSCGLDSASRAPAGAPHILE